jgi:DNA polymerase I-like protein with 3'-5' exonuclease and polymerase domains
MSNIPTWLAEANPAELYSQGDYIVLDFETTNLDTGSALNSDNRLVMAVWYDSRDNKTRYAWGDEFSQQRLVTALNEVDFIVAHNVKFECQWLERIGFDTGSKPYWDTFGAEWVLSGNRQWRLNLDACLARRGMGSKNKLISNLMSLGVCPSRMPKSLLLRYALQDVYTTRDLFHDQRKQMQEDTPRLIPIVFTRSQTAPVLAAIERNGMVLDSERVEEEYRQVAAEFREVSDQLEELTGGINASSPPQVATFVYGELGFKEKVDRSGKPIRNKPTKQFPEGMPKTDEATLLSLKVTDEKQAEFMRLKKRFAQLKSALDKNLKLFLGVVREYEGWLYGSINQGITKTHRLASRGLRTYIQLFEKYYGCQFQNLPRAYKRLFTSRAEGRVVTELDGAQLEFRVAGDLGEDDMIKHDIQNKVDIHRYTASVIHACDEKEVNKYQRTAAKAHTFKPLYGGQSGTPDQRRYYQQFAEKYSGLSSRQEEWARTVQNHHRLETKWGMIAYWPNARVSRDGYLNVKTKVYNWPVQSYATAEIIPIALIHFWHRTRNEDVLIINTVHDSIITDHPEEMLDFVVVEGNKAFTTDVYRYLERVYNVGFSIPLGTGIKSGRHWSESQFTDEELGTLIERCGLTDKCIEIDDGEITLEVSNNEL